MKKLFSLDEAKSYIKQEADKIMKAGYNDKYFIKNGLFKKGPNSFNHYADRRILKSSFLFEEFRKIMGRARRENGDIADQFIEESEGYPDMEKLNKKLEENLQEGYQEARETVYNKIDNLQQDEVIELGIRLDSSDKEVSDNVCPKCGGTGYISQFANVDNGRCWKCEGTGIFEKGA